MLLTINHSWAQELYSVTWAAMSITDMVFVLFVVILENTKIWIIILLECILNTWSSVIFSVLIRWDICHDKKNRKAFLCTCLWTNFHGWAMKGQASSITDPHSFCATLPHALAKWGCWCNYNGRTRSHMIGENVANLHQTRCGQRRIYGWRCCPLIFI